jgi:hypothetical protein
MKDEMTAHERFGNLLRGKGFDRLPVIEWAPWWKLTLERWGAEGLPPGLGTRDIQLYFGLEGCIQTCFNVRSADTPTAPSHGAGIMRNAADYQKMVTVHGYRA